MPASASAPPRRLWRSAALTSALLLLAGCAAPRIQPTAAPQQQLAPAAPSPAANQATSLPLRAASFADLPGWGQDDFSGLWRAWQRDCSAHVPLLASACAAADGVSPDDPAAQHAFFEHWFRPWQLLRPDGGDAGLVTGYYEPVLAGSLTREWPYVVPVWGPPPGLVPIPPTADGVTRGVRIGRGPEARVQPLGSRAQIDSDQQTSEALGLRAIAWLQSPVDALFLQIQGSGLVQLPDGRMLRLSYAGDNGWPYKSVGRWLLETGELRGTVSMQIIRAWAELHPDKVPQMLDANPRVVFFHAAALDHPERGPRGALGVALGPLRSVAVDKRLLALGMPLWLSTTVESRPLQRLVFAQDVGGAINGALRADLFFGTGDEAGAAAGRMQSPGNLWLLLPRTIDPAPAMTTALAP